jgi:acetyl esterase/lipase
MTIDLRDRLRPLGADLTPDMMRATQALLAEMAPPLEPDLRIERDLVYGPHERHRLDLFRRDGEAGKPVLVYVHGGGFVMGDKSAPGLPFYENVGAFAARHGMVGATLTYRLAPDHRWPSGAEDMRAAVEWLRSNIAGRGGDLDRIFLMGQSAGAVHVAGYVAQFAPRIAGALLVSCIYDVAAAQANPFHKAYYGEDEADYPLASSQDGLIASRVPLLCTVSEFDIADFQRQAAAFVGAWGIARGDFPRMHWLAGHNHLSPALALGGPADTLGPLILDFIRSQEPRHG